MNSQNRALQRESIELLAPAGSFEALAAAIQGGANAVYFGVGELNMRAKASQNFCIEDLPAIVSRCHRAGLRAYLTLNTVVYDQDMAAMHQLAAAAKAARVDAVIASDIAVLQAARGLGLPIHVSTQLNVSNIEAVRFFSAWADTMVLARELSLDQVAAIAAAISDEDIRGPGGQPVRLEIFAHGALCMAISGKCYLSLHEYGLSANRGSCVQICRRAYEVRERDSEDVLAVDNEYIMSPKDLCTIHFLNKILDAGVTVLKIEGRARSPEYVKTVCAVYNEALLAVAAGSYPEAVAGGALVSWRERLGSVFNRGFWDGYYLGQRLGEWSSVYGSEASLVKQYVGKVVNYFAKAGAVEVLIENEELHRGDSLLFIGPSTGVHECSLPVMELDGQTIEHGRRGQSVTFLVDQRIRRSDKLYKLVPRPPA